MKWQKLSNIYPFLVIGVASFSYAGFGYDDVTFYEYDPDWSIDYNAPLPSARITFKTRKGWRTMKLLTWNIYRG
jgi:hypothetical protein